MGTVLAQVGIDRAPALDLWRETLGRYTRLVAVRRDRAIEEGVVCERRVAWVLGCLDYRRYPDCALTQNDVPRWWRVLESSDGSVEGARESLGPAVAIASGPLHGKITTERMPPLLTPAADFHRESGSGKQFPPRCAGKR